VFDNIIIGSGCSAFGAYLGLKKLGKSICIIDVGVTRENLINMNIPLSKNKLNSTALKTKFGSTYPYEYPETYSDSEFTPISGAFGGFSSVWGAGLQTLSRKNLELFPDEVQADLVESQKKVLRFIPHTYVKDEFDILSPWPSDISSSKHPYILSEAMNEFYDNYISLKKKMNSYSDYYFGHPRLAIDADISSDESCVLCGMCIDGCPRSSIFDTSKFFVKEIENNNITYIQGFVNRIVKNGDKVQIFYDAKNKVHTLETKKLFLAAGPVASSVILLKSKIINDEIMVQDSQVFYKYLISKKLKRNVSNFSLSHGIFAYSPFNNLDEYFVSLYPFSHDLLKRLPQNIMKIIERIKLAKLFFSTIKYIIPAIGFLPSEVSGKLQIKSGNDEKIHVTYIENNQTTKYLRNADQNFNNLISKIGFFKIPLRYPKKIGIGVGVHIGASIPMGSNNVDNYGQITGFEDIHVVDASVLPRIFPGGHTLATMANAYRIANHVS
jgi:hypothetical protein